MEKEAKTFFGAVADSAAKSFLALSLAALAPEPSSYRTEHYRAPVPDTLRGATVLHVQAFTQYLRTADPVLIDVLPAPAPPADARPGLPRMPVPHLDIPHSHWLAEVGRGVLPPAAEAWFRARLSVLTAGNLARPLVFYCLSQCWMSWNAAKRAVSYGYSRVTWFPDGADGWEAAGNSLVQAPAPERPPTETRSSLSQHVTMP